MACQSGEASCCLALLPSLLLVAWNPQKGIVFGRWNGAYWGVEPRMLSQLKRARSSILTHSFSFYHKGRAMLSHFFLQSLPCPIIHVLAPIGHPTKKTPTQTVMISIAAVVTSVDVVKQRSEEKPRRRNRKRETASERTDRAKRASERNNKQRAKKNRIDDKKAHAFTSKRQMGLRKCAFRIAIAFDMHKPGKQGARKTKSVRNP